MSKKKKEVIEEPEVMIEPEVLSEEETVAKNEVPAVEEVPAEKVESPAAEKESYIIPEVKTPPRSPYEIAMAIREDIKTTMANAPKRNDATTMPAIVNLRCKTGDFHFTMPQFDAITVEKLWLRYKNDVTPEEFVSYLYTTMGLNPPKLYMFMNIVNIS